MSVPIALNTGTENIAPHLVLLRKLPKWKEVAFSSHRTPQHSLHQQHQFSPVCTWPLPTSPLLDNPHQHTSTLRRTHTTHIVFWHDWSSFAELGLGPRQFQTKTQLDEKQQNCQGLAPLPHPMYHLRNPVGNPIPQWPGPFPERFARSPFHSSTDLTLPSVIALIGKGVFRQ